MPETIKRSCYKPGCGRLVVKGYCVEHAVSRQADNRESPSRRGYGRAHQKWRAAVILRDVVCQLCGSAAASEADHIQRISAGGERFDFANGQGLCKSCHSRKTGRGY